MATAIKGYRMTPKGPGWLGKLVDILQAYSTRKGFHYVHFPQVDGSHHLCPPPAHCQGWDKKRAGKRELIPKMVGVWKETILLKGGRRTWLIATC